VARAVRVITEVAAVDRPFDYLLDDASSDAGLGDRVRVDFNHRSVRGWIVEDAVATDELKTIKKWLGVGPPSAQLEFLKWASERWYGTWSRFLLAASSKRIVTQLPFAPASSALAVAVPVSGFSPGVIQLAPTTDPIGLVLAAYEETRHRDGSLLVLVPTEGWAGRLRGRLEQRGCPVASSDEWERARAGWPVVIGARGAALAPVPRVAGAVVIDADDESYRSSAAPTWDATAMLRERCRRDDAPLWATSMVPSPALINRAEYQRAPDLVGGWPRVEVVDRRQSDPREGVLSEPALHAARHALDGDEAVAVVVILQRLGTGRLLACVRCGELARCAQCQQAEEEVGDELACAERHELRARFCRHCGSTNLRRVKVGVTTLARDVAAQLRQPVSEVTASIDPASALARVVVGTEATWQRVRHCGVVIFVDFDQYLLAPRESARRSAITAVGKAGRLVGSRREGRGQVVIQTRRGDDGVLDALREANFESIIAGDVATAELLGLAPYGASAAVSGEAAEAFVTELGSDLVRVRATPEGFVVRAKDVDTLTTVLRGAPRPAGKLRVAVE
jgi:primosomal protein N' (replication factor Y) (superfamily II helicase)